MHGRGPKAAGSLLRCAVRCTTLCVPRGLHPPASGQASLTHRTCFGVLEANQVKKLSLFITSKKTPHQRCTMPTTKVCLWILLLKRSLLKHNPKYANRVCAFRYNETSTKVVKRIPLCMHSARKISRYWLPASGGVPVISGSPRFARGRNPGTIAKGRRGALTAGPTPNANSTRRVPWGA